VAEVVVRQVGGIALTAEKEMKQCPKSILGRPRAVAVNFKESVSPNGDDEENDINKTMSRGR